MTLAELLEILENHKIVNNSRERFTFGVFCQAKLCQKWAKSVRKRENQQVGQMVNKIFKIDLYKAFPDCPASSQNWQVCWLHGESVISSSLMQTITEHLICCC